MPIASFQLPDGKIADFEVPEGMSQEEIEQAVAPELRRLVAPPAPPKPEESGFLRQAVDIPVTVAKGAASGVRAIADIFGANNPVSRGIRGAEDYLDSLLSAEARNDQQEIARIMKEAEDKGIAAEVTAAAKAFASAPVDFLAQALGSAAPAVAGGLYAKLLKLGAAGVGAVTTGIGGATGAGIVKGSVYDAVKGALTEAGESPEVAEARAQAAQSYGGENWGQILIGTALGGLAGRTGVEKLLLNRFGKGEVAEQAAKGVGRRAAEGAVTEAIPEMAQAGQEQLAQNIALQREGFDVSTLRGVAGAATLEGLAGGALGAGLGALPSGAQAAPTVTPTPPVEEPKTVSTNIYDVVDFDGNQTKVAVTEDDLGNIVAKDVNGEEVDLTNVISSGVSIQDAVKKTFSPDDAPDPVLSTEPPVESIPEAELTSEQELETEPFTPPVSREPIPQPAPQPIPQPTPQPTSIPEAVIEAEPATEEPRIELPPVEKPAAPVTNLNEIQTGQPFTFEGFRGEGKPKEEVYTGARIAVGGEGRYIADTEESAKNYGDQVARETVTLNNPLVIRNDDEWRTLTRQAGWRFPNPFGLEEPVVKRMTESLSTLVKGQGYDGLVIDMDPRGDMAKTLYNVFGHPQVISYAPAKPSKEVAAAPSSAAKKTSDFIDAEVEALGPPPAGEDPKQSIARRIQETKNAWRKYQKFAKELAPQEKFNEAQFKMVFDRRRRAYEEKVGTRTAAPVAPKAPKAPKVTPAPTVTPTEPSEAELAGRIQANPQERAVANTLAEEMLGEVVWQNGKTAMLRVADPKYGKMRYIVAVGRKRTATDVREYIGKIVDFNLLTELRSLADQFESDARTKHNANPYVKFSQGISVSDDIDQRIEGVLKAWRKELGMGAKIHITTLDAVKRNRNKYTGPHRSIIGGALNTDAQGYMQKWDDGNYYIVFTKSTSLTRMLETIAHELGHIHQRDMFEGADPALKREVMAAYNRWLVKNKPKNVKDFLHSLRAKTGAQVATAKVSESGLAKSSSVLNPYWRSFSEWYADQVSRWAVSNDKPVGIVEQFFARLGQALRKFYKTLKGQGYLPDETFVQYLDKVKSRSQILPATQLEASSIETDSLNMLEPEIEFSEMLKKLPPGRSEELRQAAIDFADGKITAKEFDEMVNKLRPIVAREAVPKPNTEAEMKGALNVTQREKVNPQIAENTPVGTRLDIEATKKGVPVVTVHTKRPGGADSKSVGKVIGFKSIAKLRDVVFSPGASSEALEIAMGRKKEPLQTMEGRWVNISPDNAYSEAVAAFTSSEWTEIGVDPTRHSYFYDKRSTQPVTKADEVIQIGGAVFAKNVEYAAKEEFLFSEGKPMTERSDYLKDAANQLQEGLITAQEFDSLVNQYKPIRVPQGVRSPNGREEVVTVLKSNQKPMAFPNIPEGTRVGTRLDIDATRKGVPVVAIHQPKPNIGSAKQPIIGYDSVARLTNVKFAVGNQTRALKIAAGAFKEPLQTMEGTYSKISPEQAVAIAKASLNDPSWTQVGVDPERHAYFYDKKNTDPVASADEIIQIGDQVFAKNVVYAPKEEFLFSQMLSPEDAGKMALDLIDTLGRGVQPEKTRTEKIKEIFVDDKGNVKLTPENAKKTTTQWLDQAETWAFSSDAAFNNSIRRTIKDTTKTNEEKIGVLLSISSSQAVHADAIASLFMRYGAIKYNPETYKYEAVDKKDNLISLVKAVDELAKKYKMTKEQAERVAHTAFEAKRLRSLQEFNEALNTQIEELRFRIAQARSEGDLSLKRVLEGELRRKFKDFKFIHEMKKGAGTADEQIQKGLNLFNTLPELNSVVDIWNGIRLNAAVELVDNGLWSLEEAEILLSNMDYVPFYREDQLEQGKGPKEFLRNLQVQAKEKKLKGSELAVNDIFDNMARWTQYAIKRSVMNRLAVAKIDAALEAGLATKVKEAYKGKNSVRVWRDGVAEFYELDDPMFMEAFAGLESVSMPTWKIAAKFSNFLRKSVVLNPLFSLSQVPQDAFAAIYTSGLKPRFALSIPARAVKEFVLTLAKTSKTNKELERIGIVGIRDFTSSIAREDAEVAAGLKSQPGVWNKVKELLEHVSMASDNAVRQAVYEATMAQAAARASSDKTKPVTALDQAQAYEKAFQLINFRNRGSSKFLSLAGQVIPFFNAYLAAQHVAIKTISGVGISPGDRKEALKTLAYTTAAMTALALVYSMMMDDDEEYKATPSVIRDRLLMIPGVKMSIPIRPDIFSIPKIITEHMYMINTNQGSADGRKFRDSMKAALGNALFSPTVVPQAVKPIVEVGINYNFFQGRPLVGTYQKGLETERQFNDSTSEFAKALGNTGLISPIDADHLIRGMLGSVGGLSLLLTNGILHSDPSVPRPEMTMREAFAAIPGTSGFVRREYETGLKNDFYVLRDAVSEAVNTMNDIKARSPHEIEEFLADEKNINRIGLQKATNKITQNLSKIRREISRITLAADMTAREKQEAIKELKDIEQEMLSGIDIKELRSMAQL